MLETGIYLFLLLLIFLIFGSAAYAGLKASPWLPVKGIDVERVIKLAGVKPDDVVYDLGSGDGRIIIGIANNSEATMIVGYEISFILYVWSKIRIWFLGLKHRIEIRGVDFLSRDLSQASVIFVFLTPMAMKKLSTKFKKELRPGTRIISYSFSLPDWQPVEIDRPNNKTIPIFKYVVD
ncbi:hypothetical protein KKF61_05300 [Patescibacteria group bacterium]|nr:hypothetical protein [Patescibacteria group bacterium]MBU0963722.1 hypothetical protein [Patescibacteria group bacterium]